MPPCDHTIFSPSRIFWIDILSDTSSTAQIRVHSTLLSYAGIVQHYKMEKYQDKNCDLYELLVTAMSYLPCLISMQGKETEQELNISPKSLLHDIQSMIDGVLPIELKEALSGLDVTITDLNTHLSQVFQSGAATAALSLFILHPEEDTYAITLKQLQFACKEHTTYHSLDPEPHLHYQLSYTIKSILYTLNESGTAASDVTEFLQEMRKEGQISMLSDLPNFIQLKIS